MLPVAIYLTLINEWRLVPDEGAHVSPAINAFNSALCQKIADVSVVWMTVQQM